MLELDVVDKTKWAALADKAIERFGKIHMLVNNAGVADNPGPIEKSKAEDWRWVIDVNLMGCVFGAQTMIPHIKQHGEGGWVINVASVGGLGGAPFAGAYSASKLAVVGMAESWYQELSAHNIAVSVLCPGFVTTRINKSKRNKQTGYKVVMTKPKTEHKPRRSKAAEDVQKYLDEGLSPDVVGLRLVEGIQGGELYIFTHPSYQQVVQFRADTMNKAFERAAKSELLKDVLDQEILSSAGASDPA